MRNIKKCPYCAEDILAEAVKCKHCGEWLKELPSVTKTPDMSGAYNESNTKTGLSGSEKTCANLITTDTLVPPAFINEPSETVSASRVLEPEAYSYVQPKWQLVTLFLVTLGLYTFYWFYRNGKQLMEQRRIGSNPFWSSVGLVVPILGLYLFIEQMNIIRDWALELNLKKIINPTAILASMIVLGILYRLPDPWYLLGMLSVIPLVYTQRTLNLCWECVQLKHSVKRGFNSGEIATILVGLVFITLITISTLLPDRNSAASAADPNKINRTAKSSHYNWIEYLDPKGTFHLMFPGKPTKQSSTIKGRGYSIQLHTLMYETTDGTTAFLICYSDYPRQVVELNSNTALLNYARDGMISEVKGKLVSESRIKHSGVPGRDVVIRATSGGQQLFLRYQLFISKSRLYNIGVCRTEDTLCAPEVKRFFASLEAN